MQRFIFAFWPACCPCHTSLALCFPLGFGPSGMLFLQSDGPSQRSIWRPCTLLFIHVVPNSNNDGLEDAWGPFWRDTGRTIWSLDSCDEFLVCHCFPLLEPVGSTDEPHLHTRPRLVDFKRPPRLLFRWTWFRCCHRLLPFRCIGGSEFTMPYPPGLTR